MEKIKTLTLLLSIFLFLPPFNWTPAPALKSRKGRESKSDTSIVDDPGAVFASSSEFSSACARDRPAIPVPMIATRLIGGDDDDSDFACGNSSKHNTDNIVMCGICSENDEILWGIIYLLYCFVCFCCLQYICMYISQRIMASAESKQGEGNCTNGEQCRVFSVLAIVDLCREGSIKMKKMFMTSFATQEERRAQAHKSCKIIPYIVGRETVKLRPNATQNEFQVNAI